MKTVVKFTGITDAADVARVPEGGIVGFVVGPPGTLRAVPAESISSLMESLHRDAEAWAVVRDPTAAEVRHLLDEVGVDRLQIYGRVPDGLEFLEIHHSVPSLAIGPPGGGAPPPTVPPAEDFARLHLDSAEDPIASGSSSLVDWETCRQLVDGNPGRKLLLAGGLTPDNVGEALRTVHPWGVDVSAGVESSPGRLDPEKVAAFLRAVAEFDSAPA